MAPPKWDEEDEETSSGSEAEDSPPVAARRKFDDEEDSDEVLDSWDAAEDSEAEREKAKQAAEAKAKADAAAAANKKSKAQRVEEHREANRRRRAAEEEESSEEEDETDRRARLRHSEQEADLKHAQDLLDSASLGTKNRSAQKTIVVEDKSNPGQTIDLSNVPLFKPANRTQFEALSAALAPLLTASSTKAHYSIWAQDFVKKICAEMPSAEIKKAASGLTALSNEKMKEEKAQDKTGKKSKAAKGKATLSAGRDVGRGVADTSAYGNDDLGDDDFM
ncbi:MAG: hypothetical protein Q9227_003339 [Pyrenula ochraceoflavens]